MTSNPYTFRNALTNPDVFAVNWELIPGRGAVEAQQEAVMEAAERAGKSALIHGVGITDNPGGNPALSAEFAAREMFARGIEPLVHFACRDKNRNEIESMLYGLARVGVQSVLVLTGDYPSPEGFGGTARPVFDLDPVQVMEFMSRLNDGLEYEYFGKPQKLVPTDFFPGVAVSPFKAEEAELMGQYGKLAKKIRAGGKFAVSQVGYDARKLHELLLYLKRSDIHIPVVANIYILTFPNARVMHRGDIPGCVVTDKLLEELAQEREAPDKGKQKRIERAAKQYALARGMGCAGAHIGGHNIPIEMVEEVVERGEELSGDWERYLCEFDYPQKNGFYYFAKDEATGLNDDDESPRSDKGRFSPSFVFSRLVHALFYEPKSPFFRPVRAFFRLVESSHLFTKTFGLFERLMKVTLFDCMDCGDCALLDTAYLCPMSQCPKSQRNGPCGGSSGGWCEVYPNEKLCVWVRAYRRMMRNGTEDGIEKNMVPPVDWALWKTSSWGNYFLGRDHLGKALEEEAREPDGRGT